MADLLHVSVRELRVVVERVLIGAGLPRGCVPAAVDLVLYAELLGGDALAFLRDRLPALERADPARVVLLRDGSGPIVLDAAGQPSLLVGPTALDLACAQARARGTGAAVVLDPLGLPLLRALPTLAARRGLLGFVAVAAGRAPGDGSGHPDSRVMAPWPAADRPDASAVAALAAPGAAGAMLALTGGDSGLADLLSAVARQVAAAGDRPAGAGEGHCLLLCVDLSVQAPRPAAPACTAIGPALAATEPPAGLAGRPHGGLADGRAVAAADHLLARALRAGIAVPSDLWWWLFERGNETLSPASERSRMDAGPPPGEVD